MNKYERVKAALAGEDIDRVPMSIWLHYPHKDQDPRSLADIQVEIAREYDFDFIKMCPFGLYGVQDWGVKVKIFGTTHEPAIVDDYAIHDIKDWGSIEELPAMYGTYGKQVQLAQHVAKHVQGEIPFIQTIFSPITLALKLAGDRMFSDMREDPAIFHQALKEITKTQINFVKANIEAGVSGFFFATQNATTDNITDDEFAEFGEAYDLELINSYNDETFFNVVHIHGDNVMFNRVAEYPVNCVNWHDRWVSPSLGEARSITDKCILGGINEKQVLATASPEEVKKHVAEAIKDAGKTKLMIGPGCVAEPLTPLENYRAVRDIVNEMTRK